MLASKDLDYTKEDLYILPQCNLKNKIKMYKFYKYFYKQYICVCVHRCSNINKLAN